tara:strand:+ start:6485 stop:7699 length:1215 start_codon:yes stop_codon:yes gene_type:complete
MPENGDYSYDSFVPSSSQDYHQPPMPIDTPSFSGAGYKGGQSLHYPQAINADDELQHSVHIRIYSQNSASLGGSTNALPEDTGDTGQTEEEFAGQGVQCTREACFMSGAGTNRLGGTSTDPFAGGRGGGGGGGESFRDPPYTSATSVSDDQIWLPYPQSISMTNGWNWEPISVKKTVIGDLVEGDVSAAAIKTIRGIKGKFGKIIEENADRGIWHKAGAVLNPRIQTMFNDPIMRTYSFEWDIAPKNINESADVENIIRLLKYHGAPSLMGDSGSIYSYPSEFQVLFFSKSGENKFIGRMDRCALTSVDVNYTNANMVSMFRGSHAPTHLKLTLQFTELSLQSRENLMAMDGQAGGEGSDGGIVYGELDEIGFGGDTDADGNSDNTANPNTAYGVDWSNYRPGY